MTEEHTVAVVPEAEAIDNAYNEGYDRFKDTPESALHGPGEPVSVFKEGAEWSNQLLPSLRASAGYVDSGPGTYTVERKVVVVPTGSEDDFPRDGVQMNPQFVFEALVSAFDTGAYDALEGNDRDPMNAESIR